MYSSFYSTIHTLQHFCTLSQCFVDDESTWDHLLHSLVLTLPWLLAFHATTQCVLPRSSKENNEVFLISTLLVKSFSEKIRKKRERIYEKKFSCRRNLNPWSPEQQAVMGTTWPCRFPILCKTHLIYFLWVLWPKQLKSKKIFVSVYDGLVNRAVAL